MPEDDLIRKKWESTPKCEIYRLWADKSCHLVGR
jgi:hypothetical protein